MKILFINNDGAGFADYVETESGTTVGAFFAARCKGRAADYLIRVNRQPVAQDYELQEGDRVSITPTKIEGARAAVSAISLASAVCATSAGPATAAIAAIPAASGNPAVPSMHPIPATAAGGRHECQAA